MHAQQQDALFTHTHTHTHTLRSRYLTPCRDVFLIAFLFFDLLVAKSSYLSGEEFDHEKFDQQLQRPYQEHE